MKVLLGLLALALGLAALPATAGTMKLEDWFTGALAIRDDREEDWKVNVAAGAGYAPDYDGSDDYKAFPLLLVDSEYQDKIFLSTARGFGYNVVSRSTLRAGFRLTIDYGRDAHGNTRLKTLDDVEPTPEIGAFSEGYIGPWRFKFDIRQGMGGHQGLLAGMDIARAARLDETIILIGGAKLTIADSNYLDAFYGVPRNNSLRYYSPDSGLHDVAGYLALVYQFDRNWYMSYDARYSFLLGDAADSPVVDSTGQAYLGLTVGYRF